MIGSASQSALILSTFYW